MIYVLSGGVGKLFAAIGVTYPAGSTLTCTNGTKTLKAKTTTGQWVFAIPEAGTWTVTATDGTNTKSQSVSITKEGQFESVELSYALVLFDGTVSTEAGSFKKLYATGATTINSPTESTITPSSGALTLSGNMYNAMYAANTINASDYKTLYMDCTITGSFSYVNCVGVTTTAPKTVFAKGSDAAASFSAQTTLAAGTYTGTSAIKVDISGVSGTVYFMAMYYSGSSSTVKINKIWLE